MYVIPSSQREIRPRLYLRTTDLPNQWSLVARQMLGIYIVIHKQGTPKSASGHKVNAVLSLRPAKSGNANMSYCSLFRTPSTYYVHKPDSFTNHNTALAASFPARTMGVRGGQPGAGAQQHLRAGDLHAGLLRGHREDRGVDQRRQDGDAQRHRRDVHHIRIGEERDLGGKLQTS